MSALRFGRLLTIQFDDLSKCGRRVTFFVGAKHHEGFWKPTYWRIWRWYL